MSDLVAFLTGRWDELEALAVRSVQLQFDGGVDGLVAFGEPAPPVLVLTPAYVLADVAAKRRVVEMTIFSDSPESAVDWWLEHGKGLIPPQPTRALTDVLLAFAQPFAAHPDFDPAWAWATARAVPDSPL